MRFLVASLVVVAGCASVSAERTLPRAERVEATPAQADAARASFADALDQLNRGNCEDAVAGFDSVAVTFPESRYVSASLYNAGLCLQRLERWSESVARYERLLGTRPASRDTKHARFQLAFLYLEVGRHREALEVAEMLEAHTGLTPDERSEIMARRAAALLGMGELDTAAAAAQDALRFYRTRDDESRVHDPFFAADAGYTYAETLRRRSEAIAIPEAQVETQHAVLETRAALLLRAQRAYFDAMRVGDAYWASAAGYRIGAMYDRFWDAVVTAPVPPATRTLTDAERVLYDEHYRARLAELAQPLVRHAIRYWELTLAMVERTGVRSEWTERIRVDLARARARLTAVASRCVLGSASESPGRSG